MKFITKIYQIKGRCYVMTIKQFMTQCVIFFIFYKFYQMSDKSLEKLPIKYLQRNNNSSQKIIRMEKQFSYKQLPLERGPRKRDLWLHMQKNLAKKKQISQSKPLKNVKLDPLQPRSSFKIIQSAEKMTSISKKYEQKTELQQMQNEIINKKIRIIPTAFERNESEYEKRIKKYFSNFLSKHSEKDLIIAQPVASTLNRVNYFWWNVLATLFGTIKFAVGSNVSLAQNVALAYFLMEKQLLESEAQLLKEFQDPNHIVVISQCLYFQRLLCFYVAYHHQSSHNQKSQIAILIDLITKLTLLRSLMLQIVNQSEQSFLKFNKLKKTSYLIRQKKLIQINKIIVQMRQISNKFMKTSTILKWFIFNTKSNNCYADLKESTDTMKQKLLHIPKTPFVKFSNNNYTIICDPEGLFYSEDKKNTCIIIKPYTQDVLRQLSQIANIVLFSKKKMKSIEPFLLQTSYIPFAGILDKQYETYREGRRVKDLRKLGCNLQKSLVLDLKYQKYYHFNLNNCIPIIKQPAQSYFNFLVDKIRMFIGQGKIIDESVNNYFIYDKISLDKLKK